MKTKTKMPKQQNLSLSESDSIQYLAYKWWTVFRQIINTSLSAGLITGKTKTKMKKILQTKTKLKLQNNWKTKTKK